MAQLRERVQYLIRIGKAMEYDKYDYIQQYNHNLSASDRQYNAKIIKQTEELLLQDIQFLLQLKFNKEPSVSPIKPRSL